MEKKPQKIFVKCSKDLEKFCRGCLGDQGVVDMKGASCKGISVIEMYLKVTNTQIDTLPGQLRLCISCTSVLYQTHKFLKMISKSLLVLTLTDRALNAYKKFDHTYAKSGVDLEHYNSLSIEELTKLKDGVRQLGKGEMLKLKFEDSIIQLDISDSMEKEKEIPHKENEIPPEKILNIPKKKVTFKYKSYREFSYVNKTICLLRENITDISEIKDRKWLEYLLKRPSEIWPNRNIIINLLKKYNITGKKPIENIANNIKTEVTDERIVKPKIADDNKPNVTTEDALNNSDTVTDKNMVHTEKEIILDDFKNMNLEPVFTLEDEDDLMKFTVEKEITSNGVSLPLAKSVFNNDLLNNIKTEKTEISLLDQKSDSQSKDMLDLFFTPVLSTANNEDKNKDKVQQTVTNKRTKSKQLVLANDLYNTDVPLINLSKMPQKILREICLVCHEIDHLETHMQKVHRVIWEDKKCARCQEDFTTFEDLISHCKSENHSSLKCGKCCVKYDDEESFLRHVSLRVCQKTIERWEKNEQKRRKRQRPVVSKVPKVRALKFENLSCNKCDGFTASTFKDMFAHFQNEHPKERSCSLCEQSFEFREAVLTHLAVHSKRTFCTTHFMAFDTIEEYKKHIKMKNHNSVCIECDNVVFADRKLFMRHRKRKHLTDDKIKCPQCPLTYEFAVNLKRHIRRFHEKVKLICDQCGNSYTDSNSLKLHKARVHDGQSVETKVHGACCDDCGQTFYSQSTMYLHKSKKHGLHLCSHCRQTFSDPKLLEEHVKEAGHEHLECQICHKKYAREETYIYHLETHKDTYEKTQNIGGRGRRPSKYFTSKRVILTPNENGRYPCSICGRDFKTVAIAKLHRSLHFPAKPFKCETCGKSFRIKKFYLEHMNTHTGNRPHRCKYCDKRFMTDSARYQHEAIHTGKRPHGCPVCKKTFITSSSLRKHVQIHMKDGKNRAQLETFLAHRRPKIQTFATETQAIAATSNDTAPEYNKPTVCYIPAAPSTENEAETRIQKETAAAVCVILENDVERQEDPLIYY